MVTPEQAALIEGAFRSMDRDGTGLVRLEDIFRVFDASSHPRVRDGELAPAATRDMLMHQFGATAQAHGGVSFDVFMRFHERMAEDAAVAKVNDKELFLTDTIIGVWRLGTLLQPTLIRPLFPVDVRPSGLYATQYMSLVWVDEVAGPGSFVVHVVRDVVRPIFSRGDLPPQLRGMFAYPTELAGMKVIEERLQIATQRWLDFVWEYEEGKHAAVPGIISARVDPDTLPQYLRDMIVQHDVAKAIPSLFFVRTSVAVNPMYKRSSEEYGYGVPEEVKRMSRWKDLTYSGQACGLIYHGRVGKFTRERRDAPVQDVGSAMNI
ncbi:hypothetical protein DPX39_100075100 [Trypanosoma brucei equiperdum]|uniref:EF-hand domain-containing protein n=1 Tax=Trypanosoma brucei equiperdum TaxID=630700 RepID=A0A3L6L2Q7_9TRYP|nr:hypothetical protein DPX39_100075100 [Trypanosoma brucei equiperdum]